MANTDMLRGAGHDQFFDEPPDPSKLPKEATRSLTLQEQLFVREFCLTMNVLAAAKAACVQTKPFKFFERPAVQYQIWVQLHKKLERREINQEYVRQRIQDIAERALLRGTVDHAKVALSALELLGKDVGMFRESGNNVNIITAMICGDQGANDQRAKIQRQRMIAELEGIEEAQVVTPSTKQEV